MFVITQDMDDCITFISEAQALGAIATTGWNEFEALYSVDAQSWIAVDNTKHIPFYITQLD